MDSNLFWRWLVLAFFALSSTVLSAIAQDTVGPSSSSAFDYPYPDETTGAVSPISNSLATSAAPTPISHQTGASPNEVIRCLNEVRNIEVECKALRENFYHKEEQVVSLLKENQRLRRSQCPLERRGDPYGREGELFDCQRLKASCESEKSELDARLSSKENDLESCYSGYRKRSLDAADPVNDITSLQVEDLLSQIYHLEQQNREKGESLTDLRTRLQQSVSETLRLEDEVHSLRQEYAKPVNLEQDLAPGGSCYWAAKKIERLHSELEARATINATQHDYRNSSHFARGSALAMTPCRSDLRTMGDMRITMGDKDREIAKVRGDLDRCENNLRFAASRPKKEKQGSSNIGRRVASVMTPCRSELRAMGDMQTTLGQKDKTIAHVRGALDTCQNNVRTASAKMREYMERSKTCQASSSQLEKGVKELGTCQSELELYRQEMSKKDGDLAEYKARLNDAGVTLQDNQYDMGQCAEVENDRKRLMTEVATCRATLADGQSQAVSDAEEKGECKGLEEQLREKERDIGDMKEKLQAWEDKSQGLEGKERQTSNEATTCALLKTQLEGRLSDANSTITDLNAQITMLNQDKWGTAQVLHGCFEDRDSNMTALAGCYKDVEKCKDDYTKAMMAQQNGGWPRQLLP